jgi:hypothetical protein
VWKVTAWAWAVSGCSWRGECWALLWEFWRGYLDAPMSKHRRTRELDPLRVMININVEMGGCVTMHERNGTCTANFYWETWRVNPCWRLDCVCVCGWLWSVFRRIVYVCVAGCEVYLGDHWLILLSTVMAVGLHKSEDFLFLACRATVGGKHR